MKTSKKPSSTVAQRKLVPALTPEARENQLIALAVDLAEKQLREGTASSQVISHYLKLGSSRARLEKEILISQKELYDAKAKALESSDQLVELYTQAMEAFKNYSGDQEEIVEDD